MHRRRCPFVLAPLALAALCPPATAQQPRPVVGPAGPDATTVTTGQLVRPAGETVMISARPIDLAISPDGRFLFAKESKGVTVIDLSAPTWEVKSRLSLGADAASMTGLTVGGTAEVPMVYVTDATTGLHELAVGADGTLTKSRRIALPGPGGKDNSFPCGITLSRDGKTALVCLSRNNSLGVVDLAAGTLAAEIPIGIAPYAVAISPDGGTAFVTVWGGRRPVDGERTANTSGSKALIDEHGIAASGGVSIVSLTDRRETGYIDTGPSASALVLTEGGGTVYVANCNNDTVSVIDTASRRVLRQIVLKPDSSLPFGSMPSALALSPDGKTLYAACSGNNALAVLDISKAPAAESAITGWIPTGWFPGAIIATSKDLYIANVKGTGSRIAREKDGAFNTHKHSGSLQRLPIPPASELAAMTDQVKRDGRIPEVLRAIERTARAQAATPVPIPARPGEPSVFEHVLYIIKENRTYDQVLGDMAAGEHPKGNGDPQLCIYGRDITPNIHALADQFVLLDNYYCNGVLSADGHSWATEGNVTPYLERSFGGFKRSYTYGDDPLTYSSSGFVWDHILAAGHSFRNFGEFNEVSIKPPIGKGKKWTDVYADWKAGTHEYTFPPRIDIDNLRRYSDLEAPGWNLDIPDQVRADRFIHELSRFESEGSLPNFMLMHLPNDHTAGVAEGKPTPRAMVADNDLALGRIVEALSRSRFWPATCIFVIEDDPQDGWDHVDGHRSVCLVVSPYSRRSAVVSDFYNQAGVVHTIERIFGLTAANQSYAMAPLMTACFGDQADTHPFAAIAAGVPLDELTPPKPKAPPAEPKPGDGSAPPSQKSGPLPGQAAGARLQELDLYALTARQDMSRPDRVDDGEFNLVLWHASRGMEAAYPGALSGGHGKGLARLALRLERAPSQRSDDDDDDGPHRR